MIICICYGGCSLLVVLHLCVFQAALAESNLPMLTHAAGAFNTSLSEAEDLSISRTMDEDDDDVDSFHVNSVDFRYAIATNS